MTRPHRGDVCDKWHRYCECGRKPHIHADECPACGSTEGRSRVHPAAREDTTTVSAPGADVDRSGYEYK